MSEELPAPPDATVVVLVCPMCKAWTIDAHRRAKRDLGLHGLWAAVGWAHLEHVRTEHRAAYAKHLGGRRELMLAQVRIPRWWVWR